MKFKCLNQHKVFQLLVTLTIALSGGLLFNVFNWPIPWLLGTMTSVLIVNQLSWINLYWPVLLRNIGLIIVGYSIGLTFTNDTLKMMITHLPSMAFMTILLLLICSGMALIISRFTSINFPTALTSSIPGGLSQIITFAEETKGIDITTVTFFQVTRLIVIIFAVPFLIFSPIFSYDSETTIPNVISEATTSSFFPPDYSIRAIFCDNGSYWKKN
ncbi:AbrB family transcriptional regulator [Fictibacillus phosphorivorans]|uniref:AbrB family transcriptional regulator n=1 Tax=Fictibacillus phosphorivorans TaxID=1221500 RepID=UPI002240F3C8|nr:AbrB family transcriptional regulator [Fictibacillus phosphorivorans]